MLILLCLLLAGGEWAGAHPRVWAQATDAEIESAIEKGVQFILRQGTKDVRKGCELAAYALYRGGIPADHPQIAEVLIHVRSSIRSDAYKPFSDHYYTAGTAALLLEAVDPVEYKSDLESIANYILAGQSADGSWYYPDQKPNYGDTSITQYALLGLWAAHKAGVEIPDAAWDKAASWLRRTQVSDGFTYHPLPNSPQQQPTHSMTSAGTSSLLLCRRELYPGADYNSDTIMRKPTTVAQTKLYGILELVDVTQEDGYVPSTVPVHRVENSLGELNASIRRGVAWLENNYEIETKIKHWNFYYLYGLERTAAFGNFQQLGAHDWYLDGARFMIGRQKSDGSWDGTDTPRSTTCFCVLFLSQATAKALDRPRKPILRVGTGLLTAGRGLPDDLRTVQLKDGKVETLKSAAPISDLLSQLESTAGAELEPLEEAIIESVRSEQREELIGQIDRLKKLLASKEPRVRGIALWALARSNDLTHAPLFIAALDDRDFDVALEANRGLCLLSRKLDGVGLPADPLKELRETKSEDELAAAAKQWRHAAKELWSKWYLGVRPYSERDDLLDRPRKN